MSITLVTAGQENLWVNVWNWGVLHDLVAEAALFPAEAWAPKRYNGSGDLDATQAATLATFLEERVLPRLKDGERMFIDGTVTAAPDDGAILPKRRGQLEELQPPARRARERDRAASRRARQRVVLLKGPLSLTRRHR